MNEIANKDLVMVICTSVMLCFHALNDPAGDRLHELEAKGRETRI